MKPSRMIVNLMNRFKADVKRPVYIEGSPGLGKSQIPRQVAKELGVGFMIVHSPLLQPEDVGLPAFNENRTNVKFIVPQEKFPLEGAPGPDRGIFLIDEIAQADANIQKILANLVQEREIHGQKIKDGWQIVATGNRTTDRAGANRLLSHLADRVTIIELETSLDDWSQWALKNGVKPEVLAFIRFRPELLNNFNPQNPKNATPRGWAEGVSATLGSVDPMDEYENFKGDVGEGPATEFLAFLHLSRKAPSPDAILLSPDKIEVPQELDVLYAVCGALAHRASKENFDRLMKFVNRIPGKDGTNAEFMVLFVRDAINLTKGTAKDIQDTKAFIEWASKYSTKLLA